jgi:hypothetical protein
LAEPLRTDGGGFRSNQWSWGRPVMAVGAICSGQSLLIAGAAMKAGTLRVDPSRVRGARARGMCSASGSGDAAGVHPISRWRIRHNRLAGSQLKREQKAPLDRGVQHVEAPAPTPSRRRILSCQRPGVTRLVLLSFLLLHRSTKRQIFQLCGRSGDLPRVRTTESGIGLFPGRHRRPA